MKPRILISGSPTNRPNYESAVLRAGGDPMFYYCPSADISCDGLILAGGDDMDPEIFWEENQGSRGIDRERDLAELALMSRFVLEGKPVLGICRGHQVANVALGGNLYQDIGKKLGEIHAATEEGNERLHSIRIAFSTMLDRLYGEKGMVNSTHHQAVRALGQGLYATAWDEIGLVEAMQHATLPIYTVQFHPERMHGSGTLDGSKIFEFFVQECGKSMKEEDR